MEDNFFEQIKEAESKAEIIISEAQTKAAQIELDASKEIELFRDNEQSRLASETEEFSIEVTRKANEDISSQKDKLAEETDELAKEANKNMDKAVGFIMEKVIGKCH